MGILPFSLALFFQHKCAYGTAPESSSSGSPYAPTTSLIPKPRPDGLGDPDDSSSDILIKPKLRPEIVRAQGGDEEALINVYSRGEIDLETYFEWGGSADQLLKNSLWDENEVERLIGTTVTELTKVQIKDLANDFDVDLDAIGLRAGFATLELGVELIEALKDGTVDATDVITLAANVTGEFVKSSVAGVTISETGELIAAAVSDEDVTYAMLVESGVRVSFVSAGTAIGSLVSPGLGSLVGGMLGGLAADSLINYRVMEDQYIKNIGISPEAYFFSKNLAFALPVILDLDNDGIELTTSASFGFDYDFDGYKESGTWVSADDGILVLDLDADGRFGSGDGKIDQEKEFALSAWGAAGATDLEAIATAVDAQGNLLFDSDGDGKLTENDQHWDSFHIWQDLDQDGEVDDGELRSLNELGFDYIELTYFDGSSFSNTDDDNTFFANTLHGFASYSMNGVLKNAGAADMSFGYAELGYKFIETNYGFSVEFETGSTYRHYIVDPDGQAWINLTYSLPYMLDGATGDDRNNTLYGDESVNDLTISGGAGNDHLRGGFGNDLISGDEGADILKGAGGDDVIFFDSDDTTVHGGEGVDVAIAIEFDEFDENGVQTGFADDVTLDLETNQFEAARGGDGNDHFFVSETFEEAVSLHGGEGNDTLEAGAADDVLSGDAGEDTLSGRGGGDIIIGGLDSDTADGGSGSDFFSTGQGDDTAFGGTGGDYILGGFGQDTLHGGSGDDFIDGGEGSDSILGDGGDDQIFGRDGLDYIVAGSGDDYVEGGAGNDTFVDGHGDDIYLGGQGDDIVDKSFSNYAGIDIYLGGSGEDTLILGKTRDDYSIINKGNGRYLITSLAANDHNTIEVQDVEKVQFTDEDASVLSPLILDVDLADDGAEDFDFEVTYHDDSTSSNSGHYGSGSDDIEGGSGDSYLLGSTGSDTLNGNGGEDDLDGGFGADEIFGGTSNDVLEGGSGADLIVGGDGSDSINGGSGNDTIIGDGNNSDDDTSADNESNVQNLGNDDILEGGEGDDVILGGKGNDTITDIEGSEFIIAGIGDDVVDAGSGSDRIYGGDGADDLSGGIGDDYLIGDSSYSEEVTTYLIVYLSYNVQSSSRTSDVLDQLGMYDYADVVNYYLGWRFGHFETDGSHLANPTETGQVFAGSVVSFVKNEDIDVTPELFLDDVLPRAYGRAPTEEEYDHWLGVLESGGTYADVVLGLIGEGLENQAIVDHAHQIYGEYTSAELATLSYDDHLKGGSGNDEASGMKGDDLIEMGSGQDQADGGSGNDTIFGEEGDDELSGGTGDDILVGGSGRDVLEGGDGADQIFGDNQDGTGENPIDLVSYESSYEAVNVNLTTGVVSGGHAEGDTLVGIEGVIGSDHSDTIYGYDTWRTKDILYGGAGSDTIIDNRGSEFMYGGAGSDYLNSGQNDDRLYGEGGHDVLFGEEQNDFLSGGTGRDLLDGGRNDDVLVGGEGGDLFALTPTHTNYLTEDIVEDYELGVDLIKLHSTDSFATLSISQDGDDALVSNGIHTMRLINVDSTQLGEADFVHLIDLGGGNTTVDYSSKTSAAIVDAGAGDDNIKGSGFDDMITLGTGADIVDGGLGDDHYFVRIDANDTGSENVEVELTEVYRGMIKSGQFKAGDADAHFSTYTIDGNTSSRGESARGYYEYDLNSEFELTRIDLHASSTHSFTGLVVEVLDGDRNVIETIEISSSSSLLLSLDLSSSDQAQYVRIGNDQNSLYLNEVKFFGYDTATHDIIRGDAGEDTLVLQGVLSRDQVSYKTDGNDLILLLDHGHKITIEDQWADLDNLVVEHIEFDNGQILHAGLFHIHGGDDELTGTSGVDTLHGFLGDDVIEGGAGGDNIKGGEGDDHIKGGTGIDTLDGGEGIDTVDVSHTSYDGIIIDLTINKTIFGTSGNEEEITNFENAIGGLGQTTFIGDDGNNVFTGHGDLDNFHGGLGNDTLIGGGGSDKYHYNFGDGNDTIVESIDNNNGGTGSHDDDGGVDRIQFGAGISQSDVELETRGQDLLIKLSDGSVITVQNAQTGRVEHLDFDDGSSLYIGKDYNMNVTYGGQVETFAGDDIVDLSAWAANDTINTGGGSDTIHAAAGDDLIYAGAGDDFIFGEADNDDIYGEDGDDWIVGGDGDDKLYGGAGDDYIADGFGVGDMDGGEGIDTVDVSHTDSDGDIDLVQGKIIWSPEYSEDAVNFENAIGTLGANVMTGTSDANTLDGQAGDDVLIGGQGDDILIGGLGADEFVFADGDGIDTIQDFNINQDSIDFTALGITYAQLQIEDTGDGSLVTYSTDINGVITGQIKIEDVHADLITEDVFQFV